MLALGFAGGLLDMELVVHSDRHKRERPAREAEALECIGSSHGAKRDATKRHPRTNGRTMPEHLVAAELGGRRDEELVERYELLGAKIRAEMGAAMG